MVLRAKSLLFGKRLTTLKDRLKKLPAIYKLTESSVPSANLSTHWLVAAACISRVHNASMSSVTVAENLSKWVPSVRFHRTVQSWDFTHTIQGIVFSI